MSRQQWGHGYRAGLRDGMRQPRKEWWETKQEEGRNKIRRLVNTDLSREDWEYVDIGISDLNEATLIIPCPFHYALSRFTGEVYQVQSRDCLVKISATLFDEDWNFPFISDCQWSGTVFGLWWALEEVEQSMRKMEDEELLKKDLLKGESYYERDEWSDFIELRLPESEGWRGFSPRTSITAEVWRWEKS